jgi:hypothetical protein
LGISSNFRTHILTGNQTVIPGGSSCNLTANFDTYNEVLCLLSERFQNIRIGIEITFGNLFDLFAPFVGPLGYGAVNGTGTWWHAFDLRRFLPDGFLENRYFLIIDDITSYIWMLSIPTIMLLGYFKMKQNPKLQDLAQFLILSSVLALTPPIVGVGDSRYRLGAMFFYLPLIVYSLMIFHRRVRETT